MKRSLRSWLWRVSVRDEVDEELAFHIEMRTRELVARGMDPAAARELVLSRIGDLGQLTRTCEDIGRKRDREMRLTQRLEELRDDVTYAFRQMRATPGFTLVAALTLALGIGANSAIFALADATFLRPLPFGGPTDRLVMVWERRANGFTSMASPLEFRDWNEHSRSFQSMASFATGARTMRGADGTPELVQGLTVSATFFDVLAARPIIGRTFLPSDTAPLVVIGEGFWRRRYGADPTLIGRDIVVDGQSLTVVGIMPADFRIAAPMSRGGAAAGEAGVLWILAAPTPGASGSGGTIAQTGHYIHVIGRLKPSVSIEAAQSELTPIAANAAQALPDGPGEHGILVEPLRPALTGPELRLTSILLLGVVGFVLLMCCANVASLLMSRTISRTRELAVRSALGAGRRRIAAQLLTESLVLAAMGGMLGAASGAAILRTAPALLPPGLLPGGLALTFDTRVLVFCAATAMFVGIIFGLGPAWQSTRALLVQAITGIRTTGQGGAVRNVLVIAEVASAVLVLSGAGLLLRTWIALEGVDPGYRSPQALTMMVSLPMQSAGGANPYGSHDGLRQFYRTVQREIEREPGIRSVAWGGALPLDGMWSMQPFTVERDESRSRERLTFASYHMVSSTYFDTMGIPVTRGRSFTERDSRDSVPVCIVSEAFVRRFLGNRDPIGQRLVVQMLTFGREAPPVREIVGVARQVRQRPDEMMPQPQIYVPIDQNAWYQASLIVRADGPPATLLGPVRSALARVDPDRPLARIRTLDDVAAQATSRPRFRAVLVGSFALLALILAMVGVFGVLAYSVQQRTREFGVRIALGATAGSVVRMVLANCGRVIAIGAAIGLVSAAALSRSIATFLFGVQPLDPITFVLVPLVLLVTATIAVAAPAWRAARVDPVVAFRNE